MDRSVVFPLFTRRAQSAPRALASRQRGFFRRRIYFRGLRAAVSRTQYTGLYSVKWRSLSISVALPTGRSAPSRGAKYAVIVEAEDIG